MNVAVFVSGLMVYALSLAIPGQQWHLALLGGILTGLGGLGRAQALRSPQKSQEKRKAQQDGEDSAIEMAVMRILQVSDGNKPWRVIRIN